MFDARDTNLMVAVWVHEHMEDIADVAHLLNQNLDGAVIAILESGLGSWKALAEFDRTHSEN